MHQENSCNYYYYYYFYFMFEGLFLPEQCKE